LEDLSWDGKMTRNFGSEELEERSNGKGKLAETSEEGLYNVDGDDGKLGTHLKRN
jgi:hypothetical protein